MAIATKLWLPLALGRQHIDRNYLLQELAFQISALRPNSPADDAARRFNEELDLSCGLELVRLLEADPDVVQAGGQAALDLAILLCAVMGDRRSAGQVAVRLSDALWNGAQNQAGNRQPYVSAIHAWLAIASGAADPDVLGDFQKAIRHLGAEIVDRMHDDLVDGVVGDGLREFEYGDDAPAWLTFAASPRQIIREFELADLAFQITEERPGTPEAEVAKRWEENGGTDIGRSLIPLLDDCGQDGRDFALMTRLLCACYGDTRSAADIATAIADHLFRFGHHDFRKSRRLTRYALGWLAVAAGSVEIASLDDPVEAVAQAGGRVLEKLIRNSDAMAAAINGVTDEHAPNDSKPDGSEKLVVVHAIASGTGSSESREIGKDFDSINGKPLELVSVPDLSAVRERLVEEFPYVVEVIDALLGDLVGKRSIQLRPTLLVGSPGSGKSRLLRRFCGALDLPTIQYPCGGASDSSIAGTARRWSSAEPSLPLRLVRDRETANPAIILDEVDKSATGAGGSGGRLWDALMAWLEPSTAASWLDPYVGTECDLSGIVWLATANDIRCIPDPLLDRLRVLRMPAPRREDLPALATAMIAEITRQRGLDERWSEPLAGYEIEGLQKVWREGSLRSLRRLVEGVLVARDASMPRA